MSTHVPGVPCLIVTGVRACAIAFRQILNRGLAASLSIGHDSSSISLPRSAIPASVMARICNDDGAPRQHARPNHTGLVLFVSHTRRFSNLSCPDSHNPNTNSCASSSRATILSPLINKDVGRRKGGSFIANNDRVILRENLPKHCRLVY